MAWIKQIGTHWENGKLCKDTEPKYIDSITGKEYDSNGWLYNKKHKDTGTELDPEGYKYDGTDSRGFYRNGINKKTGTEYDSQGWNKDFIDKKGISFDEYEKLLIIIEKALKNNDLNIVNKEKNKLQHQHGSKSSELIKLINEKTDNMVHTIIKKKKYKDAFNIIDDCEKDDDNKKHMILDHLKGLLNDYDFQGADTLAKHYEELISYKEYIKIKKKSIYQFFIDNDRNSEEINDEKYDILADFSKYLLVKARAGTGKTTALKYKTWFLNKAYGINTDDVLVLAFNKKAAKEIGEKIRDMKVGGFRTAFTFHSLAGKILARKEEDESKELIFDNTDTKDPTLSSFVQSIFRDFSDKEVKEIFEKLYEFFKKEIDELASDKAFLTKGEYYKYVKNQSQLTLSGKTVKSKYEKWIADYLFEHGIDFYYEPTYNLIQYDRYGKKINQKYKPDFRLDRFVLNENSMNSTIKNERIQNKNVFIEFWGVLDPDSDDINLKPDHLSSKEYKIYIDTIKWKRKYMNGKGFELIELNLDEGREGREFFEKRLQAELEKRGIICKKLPHDVLVQKIKEKHIGNLTDKIVSFINKAKQNKLTVEKIKDIYQTDLFGDKLSIYYGFAIDMYERYQKKLKKESKKDFNDLLREATEYLHQKKGDINIKIDDKVYENLNNFKYILIDEYQDFSLLFWEIIDGLKKYNPAVKVICVGDDRQLINSFAGSKIRYIKDFKHYFKNGKELTLLTSNRCPEVILDASNKFMEGLGEPAKWNGKESGKLKGLSLCDIQFDYEYDRDSNGWYVKDKDIAIAFGWRGCDKKMEINNEICYCINKDRQELAQLILIIRNVIQNEGIYENNFDENHELKIDKNNIKKCLIMFRTNSIYNFELDNFKEILFNTISFYLINNEENRPLFEKVKKNLNNFVIIQTIHKSKGQEADLVVIPRVGTLDFPYIHPDNELDSIFGTTLEDVFNEEKRLFYVGLTRSKKILYYISERELNNFGGMSTIEKLLNLWNIGRKK